MKRLQRAWRLPRALGICALVLIPGLFPAVSQAEEGVTDTTILIGQTVGLTGQIAGPVKEMNAGAAAYISQVNKAGGVNGRKIELRILDDKFDPAIAAANAETLVKKEHVFVLFQSRGTPHTQAILPVLAANKIPLIAPSTGAAVFHTPVNHYLFNVRAKYQDEVKKAVEQFSTIGLKDIGIVHVDDTFGGDGLAGFTAAMSIFKLQPSIIAKYDRAKPDVAKAVDEAMKSPARALVIVGSATTVSEIIRGLRAKGSAIQIMTLSNNASQSFIDSLGPAAIGVMVSQIMPAPHLVSSILGQEFKAIAKEHGVTASYAAMEGFVSAKVLVEGLRRSGKTLTREGLVRALESMHKVDLGGVTVTYSERDHSGSEFVELTMIGRDGKFVR
ncbi:ABC transporter substrate-binding protein [Undibacterium sp. Ji50W]|uniref:ABC transporter substrate-binding protein n=1 Tax=Undibacterium sp. Ji50W TaxID=3413041 RepID=UPI003BF2E7A0